MKKLARSDLFSLEQYAALRSEFRAKIIEHKKNRQVQVGPHVMLCFEDRLTMQYQIQEMLRAERIFEAGGIAAELDAYNPLIPDGDNWKATLMIEYEDVEARRKALEDLREIESGVWIQAGESSKVWAIPDEDLEREDEAKTSAVHFLRFQLSPENIAAAKRGDPIRIGIDHPAYLHVLDPVSDDIRVSLVGDLA